MLIPVSIDNSTLAGVALATTRAPAALYSSALRADFASLNFVSASGTRHTSVPHSARWYSLRGCFPPSMRRSPGAPKPEPDPKHDQRGKSGVGRGELGGRRTRKK